MVLFSTVFPVSRDLTRSVFLSILQNWIGQSSHYSIDIGDAQEKLSSGQGEGLWKSEDGTESLLMYQTETHLAFQLDKKDDTSMYRNTYVLTEQDGQPVLLMRLEKTLFVAGSPDQRMVSVPNLMKILFWQEYGGMDRDLMMDDKAFLLRKSNVKQGQAILSGESQFFVPIVYISVDRNGRYALNYDTLASDLIGMAHVIAEGSPHVAQQIQAGLAEDVPYPDNGEVFVRFPNQSLQRFKKDWAESGHDFAMRIRKCVYRALAEVAVPEYLSFYKIRMDYLAQKLGNSELGAICDELLKEKDVECQGLRDELKKVREQLFQSNQQVETYKASFEKGTGAKTGVCLESEEYPKELYPGEIADVILKVLRKELNGMTGDSNLEGCRKYTVLKDLLEHNKLTGKDEEIKKQIKLICKQNRFGELELSELEKLGLIVAKGPNNHYRMCFAGDSRYGVIAPGTPSDSRSMENLASTFNNMLFGY